MPCADCNGNHRNGNPLDCDRSFMQCNNPCGVGQANTPACESLPSQIQNFTTQFFGEVIKTEVNGEVVWSLPCSLDIGLPNNPRGADEGLACYFLRLFRDGIGGLTGPRGLTGAPGTNGVNAYTVTVQDFSQPTLGSPLTQIVILPNPCVVAGVGIFVEGSGVYQVTGVATGGVVFVTFIAPVASPLATIPSGSLVVPMWALPGPAGPPGPMGPAGLTYTTQHGIYSGVDATGVAHPGITTYAITGSMAVVDFTSEKMEVVPTNDGTYLVNVVVSLWAQFAVSASDLITLQLRTSTGEIFYQTSVYVSNLANGQYLPVPMTAIVTPTTWVAGQSIQVFASTSGTPSAVLITPAESHISWVRIA